MLSLQVCCTLSFFCLFVFLSLSYFKSLFRSGLATVPGNAKVHFNYANFLRDTGRIKEAVYHYQTAIRLAPDHAVSHNNLGSLLEGREAELHFREAVRHNPQHHRAFYNLARNLEYVSLVSVVSIVSVVSVVSMVLSAACS